VKNLDNTFLLILLLSVVIYWDWLSIAEKEIKLLLLINSFKWLTKNIPEISCISRYCL